MKIFHICLLVSLYFTHPSYSMQSAARVGARFAGGTVLAAGGLVATLLGAGFLSTSIDIADENLKTTRSTDFPTLGVSSMHSLGLGFIGSTLVGAGLTGAVLANEIAKGKFSTELLKRKAKLGGGIALAIAALPAFANTFNFLNYLRHRIPARDTTDILASGSCALSTGTLGIGALYGAYRLIGQIFQKR